MKKILDENVESFRIHLINQEKSMSTLEKYMRDVKALKIWLNGKILDKSTVLAYKEELIEKYAPSSVNAALASINSFFSFMEWQDLRVKSLKIQKQIFSTKDIVLTKTEYERLLETAIKNKNERLYLVMQTICSTGIRVSELKYITVCAINCGVAKINCKGKYRQVLLPSKLCRILKRYAQTKKIKSGAVFITKNGIPLDRSNIWNEMRKLSRIANVPEKKVFPHNLRHLFARTYYEAQRDVVRLADILGHSSVNTTRIYTMESGEIHVQQIQNLGLLKDGFYKTS